MSLLRTLYFAQGLPFGFTHNALPAIFVLYAMYRYDWNARAVGLTLAAVGVTAAVVQGALVGSLVRTVGERRTLLIGLALVAGGFAV